MFRKISLVVISICLVMAFAACSGKKKASSENGGGADNSGELNSPVTGSVLYSSFTTDDKVCFDRNTNKQCDEGEPKAPITNGDFTIKGTSSDKLSSPVIAELHGSATVSAFINADTKAGQKIVLETPAGRHFISSVTTMIKAKMDGEAMDEDSATEKVKTDLGLAVDVEVFDKSDDTNLKKKADDVIKVLSAMITSIAGKGISIDGNALLLIANETAQQLAQIAAGKAADQIVADTVGGKTKEQLESSINEAVASKPTLQTVGQALETGNLDIFRLDMNRNNNSIEYKIALTRLSKNNMQYGEITLSDAKNQNTVIAKLDSSLKASIDAGGALVSEKLENRATIFSTIKTVPLQGRVMQSNSKFQNKIIDGFANGAKMYEVSLIDKYDARADSVIDDQFTQCMQTKVTNTDRLLDECLNNKDMMVASDFQATKNGNVIQSNSGNFNLGDVTLDESAQTFIYNPSSAYYKRVMQAPFIFPQQFVLSGKYTVSGEGDSLAIKGVSANGDLFLYIASAQSNSGKPILMVGRNSRPILSRYFNEEAMKTIRDDWDITVMPN